VKPQFLEAAAVEALPTFNLCLGSLTDIRTIGVTGRPLPSAREVSTSVLALATKRDLSTTLTGMHMTWGQFIAHDLTHVPLTPPVSHSLKL